jgi:hypothetical protein
MECNLEVDSFLAEVEEHENTKSSEVDAFLRESFSAEGGSFWSDTHSVSTLGQE